VDCPACGHSVGERAKFCEECGQRLSPPAAPSERSARDYTPRHLADRILTSRAALEGERKQVTVLFADVEGSMELAEGLDPERWHAILDRFLQILAGGVHRFEGTVNQYTGDGIMALFGAPLAHEDHAQRACYAALHLRDELRRYTEELKRTEGVSFAARLGLNSGEVVVGRIGDDLRMDYTAQGHTVGLAQRMEQLAAPGNVYLTAETAERVAGFAALRDLGEFSVKGATHPVRVFELEGPGPLRSRFDLSRARGLSYFTGRTDEMSTLEGALEVVKAGESRVVGVVGNAGVGKSRLCFEFLQRCRERGIATAEICGVSHGRGIPLLPWLAFTRSVFGVTDRDDARTAREKVAGRVVLLDESLREYLPFLFDFLGIAPPDQAPLELDAEAWRRTFVEYANRHTEARARQRPGVFLLEDLHWFDPVSEAVLREYVAARVSSRETSTLLVLNFRPEYGIEWIRDSAYRPIALAPLGPEDIRRLLRDLLGDDPSVAALPALVEERTEGNPFYIEEVVQALADGGQLEGARSAYRLVTPVEAIEVPETISAVLAARIDRLGDAPKALLQTAAVIGRSLAEPLLARAAGLAEDELAASLDALREAGMVFEESLFPVRELAFKHALTQEVAYRSQLDSRRAAVHAEVGRTLEATAGDHLDEQAALIAHHWEAAAEPLAAARWHRRAAAWANALDPAAALDHWQRVRSLLAAQADSAEILALRTEACAEILFGSWRAGLQEAEWSAAYAEGRALAERSGDTATLAALISGLAGLRGFAGENRAEVELLEEAFELAEGSGDFALQASLYQRLGWSCALAGDLDRAAAWTERGLAFCGNERERAGRVSGFATFDFLLLQRGFELRSAGRLSEADEVFARGIASAEEPGAEFVGSYGRLAMAELARFRGDLEAARRHALASSTAALVSKAPVALGMSHWGLAMAYLEDGRHREALDTALRSLDHWAEAGSSGRIETSYVESVLAVAEAALASGEQTRAREGLDEARDLLQRLPELRTSYPSVHLELAQVALGLDGEGARAEVETALERVLEAARERGWKAFEPLALYERARLDRLLGDEPSAQRDLREALRLLRAMGADQPAARLEKELGAGA
jgi:class 3 adenylate cyclase/tetratricopeptide (TPR) repeat protein